MIISKLNSIASTINHTFQKTGIVLRDMVTTKPKNYSKVLKRDIFEKRKIYTHPIIEIKAELKPELEKKLTKSKTMKRLYSPEFYTPACINKDGYFVTTIINRETNKPIKAYVLQQESSKNYEKYGIYVKKNGEYEKVGERSFDIDRENKKIAPDWMASMGNTKYAGIGLRAHQIAVERMMQKGYKTVEIGSSDSAFPFHYKSGFRIIPEYKELSPVDFKIYVSYLKRICKFNDKETNELICAKFKKGKVYLSSQTDENRKKLQVLKKQVPSMNYIFDMSLQGEQLEHWKQLAKLQPIFPQ